jgi:peptide/nickel transport system substrate-binding protein
MTLVHSWGPFLPTITQAWAAAQSKAWVTAQRDWNGECDTWQNFYGVPKESAPLYATANGTGPYQLDHWTPGEEIVLTANSHWHGGQPAIMRVVLKPAIDLGTQLAQLQVGDVDRVVLDMPADEAQLEPQVAETCDALTGQCQTIHAAGRLREYTQLPQAARAHLVFNFQIAADSPYIGSGRLDGEGVPPEFFGDVHIRRAFNYCFNWEALIQEVYVGRATQALALTLPGMPGYDGSPAYAFDPAKCEAEFKAAGLKSADGRSVWETGFYLQVPRFPGDKFGKTLIDILAAGLSQVNDRFLIVSLELPQTLMFQSMQNGLLPIISGGWLEDIHDPHNWYQPFLLGGIAGAANLPGDLQAGYLQAIVRGVKETDPARRAEIYRELNQRVHNDAPVILLANRSGRLFLPVYVDGVLNGRSLNPLTGLYYVEMKKH